MRIEKGKKIQEHLCDFHAAQAGLVKQALPKPINELLSNFVKVHSGQLQAATGGETPCGSCGMTWAEFREHSLLGCPLCYTNFEEQLGPLLERAHEGATHHIGKVPRRAGADEHRQQRLLAMRKRLAEAVAAEDYELAARLRDEIRQYEETRG
ncbi:MAG: excinuclease ABC subunit B [Phycisphaerales bacterium]|nr:excinuclease ABC subunit B [Phycisphaerales bacterium]